MEESLQKLEDLSFEQLSAFINQLIDRDFSRLVQILYRLDVSEDKLKTILIENPTGDAGELIAHLIIERIRQREENKQKFPKDPNIPEEDKW